MRDVRNGEQKEHKYLYSEIFYGGQKLHKYFCFSRGPPNGMNPSYISQQFNWLHHLIIVFYVHLASSLYDLEEILIKSVVGQETVFAGDLEAIPTKSVGQETVFVGRDTVFKKKLNAAKPPE